MRNPLIQTPLALSAIYGTAAAHAFVLHFSPSAEVQSEQSALICSLAAAIPYVVLYISIQESTGPRVPLAVKALATVVMLIGFVSYAGSFQFRDGEYEFVFFVTPMVQTVLLILFLPISLARAQDSTDEIDA